MKYYLYLPLLLLPACQQQASVSNSFNNGALFTLKDITVTSSTGQTANAKLTAKIAIGDMDAINMRQIHYIGQQEQSYSLTADSGVFTVKNKSGSLEGHVSLSWGEDNLATTTSAMIKPDYLILPDDVFFMNTHLQAVFDGASYNFKQERISSLGQVSGEFN